MKSRLKTYLLAMRNLIVLGIFVFIIYRLIIIFYPVPGAGFSGKTFWDWMQLLIIPLVLATGAFFLNRSERAVERQATKDRADLEREIAKDRQQEAALQAYVDRMSELLLKEKLLTTEMEEVRDVARTRTISILRGLDTKRNNLVFQFLREAKLVARENSILNGADMEGMNLEGVNLNNVYLQNANLRDVNLKEANLHKANLEDANMVETNLEYAYLSDANLQKTNFNLANLRGASLSGANLDRAKLKNANLKDADLADTNLKFANLAYANLADVSLQNANLAYANLEDAYLQNANLRDANLKEARLYKVNLKGANLHKATVTDEQLATAKSLMGATMPDGTIHG
jgi:uncharacterized protein YjbI with pentapeptide repeats